MTLGGESGSQYLQSHEAATLCHVKRLLKKDLVSVNKLDLDLHTPRVAFESQKDEQKAGPGAAVGVIWCHLWGGLALSWKQREKILR